MASKEICAEIGEIIKDLDTLTLRLKKVTESDLKVHRARFQRATALRKLRETLSHLRDMEKMELR